MNTTEAPSKRGNNTWKAALLLLLVFLIGAASGVGGGLLFLRAHIRKAATAPMSNYGPIDRLAVRIERHLVSSLQLTPKEREVVHRELVASALRAKELRFQLAGDVRALASDTLTRIGESLPPEKRKKLLTESDHRLELWGLHSQ